MFRKAFAVCLLCLGFGAQADDFTDLWWNPAESGWGISITQQGNTIFALWFVYGTDSAPTWYVMSNGVGSHNVFAGDLYKTAGPAFSAAAFDPNKVSVTKVGTAQLDFSAGDDRGVLSYTINGATVQKSIQRQGFSVTNPAGSYATISRIQRTGCSYSPNNAITDFLFSLTKQTFADMPPSTTITVDSSNNVKISQSSIIGDGSDCVATGVLSSDGRLATITGTYDCGSRRGTFTIDRISVQSVTGPSVNGNAASLKSVAGRFSAQDTFGETCRSTAAFVVAG